MSDHQRNDILDKLMRSVELHDQLLNGDDKLRVVGLSRQMEDNQRLDNEFREFTKKKLDDLEEAIHDSNRIVLEEIAKVATWKEGIQETPKRVAKAVAVASAFLAGLAAIGSFVWNAMEKLIDLLMGK